MRFCERSYSELLVELPQENKEQVRKEIQEKTQAYLKKGGEIITSLAGAPELISVDEVCSKWGIPKKLLKQMIRRGAIPSPVVFSIIPSSKYNFRVRINWDKEVLFNRRKITSAMKSRPKPK